MIRLPFKHERRNRFHPGAFRLVHPYFVISEVHDFEIITIRVQGLRHVFLGRNTDRTTGMIKDGF